MIKFNYGLYSKYLGVITLCAFRFSRKLKLCKLEVMFVSFADVQRVNCCRRLPDSNRITFRKQ